MRAEVAERRGGRQRRRWRRGASLLDLKLDYLELDATYAFLPAARLILAHLADDVRLLPAEASAGLRLRDRLYLREHGLLVGAMDVVARRDRRRTRGDELVVLRLE
jgi:hypothetical protein